MNMLVMTSVSLNRRWKKQTSYYATSEPYSEEPLSLVPNHDGCYDKSFMPRYCSWTSTNQPYIVTGRIVPRLPQGHCQISISFKIQVCRSHDDSESIFDVPLIVPGCLQASWISRSGICCYSLITEDCRVPLLVSLKYSDSPIL